MSKALSWILLSLMCCTLTWGYAALSDSLSVNGDVTVEAKPYEGVYIFDAQLHSQNGASNVAVTFYKPTNLSASVHPVRNGGSLTYRVTLHNNTDVTYWYIEQDFLPEFESNSLIGQANGITVLTKDHPDDTYSTFNTQDWIPPQTYRDIYVTYTFGSGAQGYPVTLINLRFGIKMDAVHDQFLTVLNDTAQGGGYDYLSKIFDEKYAETGKTVIANVGEEQAIFDHLFGSNLTITIDGEEVPVTVMIRRDNVDGRNTGDDYSGTSGAPTGCEYTVCITVDPLDSPTGKAEVFAISYSNGGSGSQDERWYQLGQLYAGTANRADYDPSSPGVQGAFDITTWVASPERYEVADGITYLVGQEQGDQYDKLKKLEDIMSTNDQDIFNDIDNSRILKEVYDIVNSSANSAKPGIAGLREAFYAASPFYNIFNGGQEVKVKRECTRSEIIPYIVHIQTALDYYNELNG